MIYFDHIRFVRESRTLLNDVTLHMEAGERWVILGRNGSGKTTLLEMINGYLFPTSGKVKVLGETYGETDVREMRKRIGYISQSLLEKMALRDPVWEAVVSGKFAYLRMYEQIAEETVHKADGMLERFGIMHLRNQPLGTLSQGERKKVLLARALMADPDILIMDEPCSGLDLYEREKFLEAIELLSESGITMVYVTHHIEEIIPLFTHAALIEQGRIVASGAKREVLTAQHLRQTFDIPVVVDWSAGRPWIRVGP